MAEYDRMYRMHFYISPELRADLTDLAERRNVSIAELIREAIQSFILHERSSVKNTPELDLIGMVDWPHAPQDISLNHCKYVYRKDWER